MLNSLKRISSYFLKILCLGCLLVMLAVPALAQEQTPKNQETSQPAPAKPAPKARTAPRPMPRGEYQADKSMPRTMEGQDSMMKKGVDDTVGGQEIRNKKEEEVK